MKPAAIGFRMHSGWGACVVLCGSAGEPELLDRKRIVVIDPAMPGAKQPYHFAENLLLPEAEKHIAKCAATSKDLAVTAVRQTLQNLTQHGYEVAGAAMLLASQRSMPALADILRSHPLIHTAEGEFFRRVVQQACELLAISVTGFRESELDDLVTSELGEDGRRQLQKVEALGRTLGPPWTQDFKRAALAAWILLAATP
jgi:hypothetical protein